MTPRDRRPDNEQGPVNWGIMPKRTPRPKSASARPGGNGLLEVVRSGNNPAPTGSSASATSSASHFYSLVLRLRNSTDGLTTLLSLVTCTL